MSTRTIEVVVSPQGDTRVETKGFTGSSCRLASRFLEEALGTSVSEKLTGEFYEQETAQHRVQQGDDS
jgi:hypothetical protein